MSSPPIDENAQPYPTRKHRGLYRLRQKRARDGRTYFTNPRPTCPHCGRAFVSDRGCSQHLSRDAECHAQQRAAIERLIQSYKTGDQFPSVEQHGPPSPTQWGPWTYPTDMPPASPSHMPTNASEHANHPAGPSNSSNATGIPMDRPFYEFYPSEGAGAPIPNYLPDDFDLAAYIGACGPFADPKVFEAAEKLVMSNLTCNERTEFLQSEVYRGQVPWHNNYTMVKDVDCLPTGPKWSSHTFIVEGEKQTYVLHAYKRDVIEVVRELIGNPKLKDEMHYAPERKWTSLACLKRIYDEMWTGDWWWELQQTLEKELDEFGTIAALIVTSDKSTVSSVLNGQNVYPVYVTLGNISKRARRETSNRAVVLLGYLPVETFKDEPAAIRPRLRQGSVHVAMKALLEPLREAWFQGVEMVCADGLVRRVHPTLAAFGGDWPELCDMTNTLGSGCPKCHEKPSDRGGFRKTKIRDPNETLATLLLYDDPKLLAKFQLRPGWPFWADLYPTNFHEAIVPDLLHQVYIGMYKHVVNWGLRLMDGKTASAKKSAYDQRFCSMTEAHGLRRFSGGVTTVKRWTGRESKEMAKIILPLIVDKARSKPILTAITALLDFCYLAHSASLSDDDLREMFDCLQLFHKHKDEIADANLLGARGFKGIAKLHMLIHYFRSTRRYGTPDGYSTETAEHLHREFAKIPWRKSTRRENAIPNMIKFLGRREAIQTHRTHMDEFYGLGKPKTTDALGETMERVDDEEWVDEEEEPLGQEEYDRGFPDTWERLALKPNRRPVRDNVAEAEYGTTGIPGVLQRYLSSMAETESDRMLVKSIATHHCEFDVWHRVRLYHRPLPFASHEPAKIDVIRAQPHVRSPNGLKIIRRGIFDTALVEERPEEFGIHRFRAVRVRLIFRLRGPLRQLCPHPLAFVEVFSRFNKHVNSAHGLYTLRPSMIDERRETAIVPVSSLAMACHLAPRFNFVARSIRLNTQADLLSHATRFFFNHYYNFFVFLLIRHWRRVARRKGIDYQ